MGQCQGKWLRLSMDMRQASQLLLVALCSLLAACGEGRATGVGPAIATPPSSPGGAPADPPTAILAPSDTPTPAAPPTSTSAPPTATVSPTAAPQSARFSYPIGAPGAAPGDGFFVRHGYAAENTWYNPGYWHTGEDWYALEGDTAGAEVLAIAAGQVVYVGANYPGRVVIVAHEGGLFSMYGHLDPAVAVAEGDSVERGQLLGAVLRRGDSVPNHLHFEVRTFLTAEAVNGPDPRYDFRCGPGCPPGPGYWPTGAPDHPSDLGWRNPTHVVAGRMFGAAGGLGEVIVPASPPQPSLTLWSAPPGGAQQAVGELPLEPGARLMLLEVRAGPEDSRETSAEGYALWYRVAAPDGAEGWVQAALASPFETGGDGRPSSVEFALLPAQ
jgi:murein DD-endopeptidase MepM/ murein hydrolase activator NlpD